MSRERNAQQAALVGTVISTLPSLDAQNNKPWAFPSRQNMEYKFYSIPSRMLTIPNVRTFGSQRARQNHELSLDLRTSVSECSYHEERYVLLEIKARRRRKKYQLCCCC